MTTRRAWPGCLLTFDPTKSRGLGPDDMLLTSAVLRIASDIT